MHHFGRELSSAAVRIAAVMLGAGLLAGCGGPVASVEPGQPDPLSRRLGNLLAFNSTNAPPGPTLNNARQIECPIVQVVPGASAVRVGEGSGVRYQISIGDVARECSMADNQVAIRVGVETRVVLGPAGNPGSYTAPLRIAIRSIDTDKIIASKVYRAGGTVSANGQGLFPIIADPFLVPYVNDRAADQYEVIVSVGEGKIDGEPNERRRRR